ncbi:hypothetical protein ACDW34_11430 [Acinetobacter piscicola]|uniref:hypothetical protein n=1 Tax=Acinetobacter piscicola TaxID=2006115 RepID=UPI00355866DE
MKLYKMIIDQSIRIVAVLALLIAALCMLGGNSTFCLYEYMGQNTVWSLDELNGGISKDPNIFDMSAMTALIFLIPLLLSYHRGWYLLFFVTLILLQTIFLSSMIDSPSVFGLVYDSIVYCQNYWLLAWVIGELLFFILSLVFVFHEF